MASSLLFRMNRVHCTWLSEITWSPVGVLQSTVYNLKSDLNVKISGVLLPPIWHPKPNRRRNKCTWGAHNPHFQHHTPERADSTGMFSPQNAISSSEFPYLLENEHKSVKSLGVEGRTTLRRLAKAHFYALNSLRKP